MISKMFKRKIKVGLDLTKENKKSETPIIQEEVNPDMDKIREAAKNIGLDLTTNQSSIIEYPRYY
jgi:hypothetical protein